MRSLNRSILWMILLASCNAGDPIDLPTGDGGDPFGQICPEGTWVYQRCLVNSKFAMDTFFISISSAKIVAILADCDDECAEEGPAFTQYWSIDQFDEFEITLSLDSVNSCPEVTFTGSQQMSLSYSCLGNDTLTLENIKFTRAPGE